MIIDVEKKIKGYQEIIKKLKDEEEELMVKMFKLENALANSEEFGISKSQCGLLKVQRQAMQTYRECLIAREEDLKNQIINFIDIQSIEYEIPSDMEIRAEGTN